MLGATFAFSLQKFSRSSTRVPLKSLEAFLSQTTHGSTQDVLNNLYSWPGQLADSYMAVIVICQMGSRGTFLPLPC